MALLPNFESVLTA